MARPVFSILTPIYKTGAFVPETIESVLAQTREDWELLLMDNACPEGGGRAAEPYLDDPRITLRHRKVNEGAVGARNDLLAVAQGRYIVQLDSDDWIAPAYLDAVAEVLDAQEDVGIAAPDAYRYMHDLGGYEERTAFAHGGAPATDDHDRTVERLIRDNFIPVPFTVRRSALDEVGGWDPRADRIWDLNLLIQVALADWKIATIRQPLATYRIRGGSTARNTAGFEREEIRLVREHYLERLIAEYPLSKRERREAKRSLERSRVRTAALSGDRPRIRRALHAFLRRRPSPLSLAVLVSHTLLPRPTEWALAHAGRGSIELMDPSDPDCPPLPTANAWRPPEDGASQAPPQLNAPCSSS